MTEDGAIQWSPPGRRTQVRRSRAFVAAPPGAGGTSAPVGARSRPKAGGTSANGSSNLVHDPGPPKGEAQAGGGEPHSPSKLRTNSLRSKVWVGGLMRFLEGLSQNGHSMGWVTYARGPPKPPNQIHGLMAGRSYGPFSQ